MNIFIYIELDDSSRLEDQEGGSKCPSFLLVRDDAGLQPIHHAAEAGNALAIHYFLCLGQDVNSRDNDKRTPLHWATHSGSQMASMYLLNRSRCLVDARDINGDTSLHWCASKGNKMTIQLLLENNASPLIQNNDGLTPIDIAKKFKFT